MKWVCLAVVRAYQACLRPFLGGSCRFYPSCSNYACEAIERYGAARGARLSLRRLLRCHPFSPGGVDPVPDPALPEWPSRAVELRPFTASPFQKKASREEFVR
jgi:putative membrane protein insertion efficiency factor